MEVVHAALLLHAAKKPVNEEGIKNILEAAGIKPDEGKIRAFITSLQGINIDEAIQQATIITAAPEKKEEKKEEVEEKKIEEAAAGLSSLFG